MSNYEKKIKKNIEKNSVKHSTKKGIDPKKIQIYNFFKIFGVILLIIIFLFIITYIATTK